MRKLDELLDIQPKKRVEINEARKPLLMDITTKKDSFSKGDTVDKISFEEKRGMYYARLHIGSQSFIVKAQNLHRYLKGYAKPPTMNKLEKMMSDAVATTVTGQRTEPDGTGSDGSPSWLLAMGLI